MYRIYMLKPTKHWQNEVKEDQTANIRWIIGKAREFQENIYLCFINYAKPLSVCVIISCGKLLKRWDYKTILPVS